jgi:hypothetical protein
LCSVLILCGTIIILSFIGWFDLVYGV